MLIDKRHTPDINDIVTIKLVSGEEIVGRLMDRTGDAILLAKPVQIIMQPVNANQIGLAFQPVLGSVNEHSTMQFSLTLLAIRPIKTNEDVTRNYIQATTGLVAADQMPSR